MSTENQTIWQQKGFASLAEFEAHYAKLQKQVLRVRKRNPDTRHARWVNGRLKEWSEKFEAAGDLIDNFEAKTAEELLAIMGNHDTCQQYADALRDRVKYQKLIDKHED